MKQVSKRWMGFSLMAALALFLAPRADAGVSNYPEANVATVTVNGEIKLRVTWDVRAELWSLWIADIDPSINNWTLLNQELNPIPKPNASGNYRFVTLPLDQFRDKAFAFARPGSKPTITTPRYFLGQEPLRIGDAPEVAIHHLPSGSARLLLDNRAIGFKLVLQDVLHGPATYKLFQVAGSTTESVPVDVVGDDANPGFITFQPNEEKRFFSLLR